MILKRWLLPVLLIATTSVVAQGTPDAELKETLRAAASDTASFTDRFDAEVWLTDMSRRL